MDGVDTRVSRLEQGLVTVILLAGFVFSQSWTIPLAAILVALDAALGDAGPVPWLWRALLAGRVGPPTALEPRPALQLHAVLVGGALVLATVLSYGGLGGLAALLAVVVAAVSALAATGLFCAGCELYRRRAG